MTTPAPDGDSRAEAREQIARAMHASDHPGRWDPLWEELPDGADFGQRYYYRLADAVLATPVVAEALAAGEVLRRVEALFGSGPDTPCRTTWPDNGEGDRIECVEVPIEDLRRALGDHP